MAKSMKTLLKLGSAVVPIAALMAQPAQARDRKVDVAPYLEVQQILLVDLNDGNDVLTYTSVAAGVDAADKRSSP